MTPRVGIGMGALFLVGLVGLILDAHAHQDPYHRPHRCPSDHKTYICGDKRRYGQCPGNPYCLAGKPRMASSTNPALAPALPARHDHHTLGGDRVLHPRRELY
jgi:hypothetical protein